MPGPVHLDLHAPLVGKTMTLVDLAERAQKDIRAVTDFDRATNGRIVSFRVH